MAYLQTCGTKNPPAPWSCPSSTRVQGDIFDKDGYTNVLLCRDHLGGYMYKVEQPKKRPEKFGAFSIRAAVRPPYNYPHYRRAGVT